MVDENGRFGSYALGKCFIHLVNNRKLIAIGGIDLNLNIKFNYLLSSNNETSVLCIFYIFSAPGMFSSHPIIS